MVVIVRLLVGRNRGLQLRMKHSPWVGAITLVMRGVENYIAVTSVLELGNVSGYFWWIL